VVTGIQPGRNSALHHLPPFMIVATMIAGIGVMLDQPILIVGAMVVGPEFGPLVALCIGIVTRCRQPATRTFGHPSLGLCRRDGGKA
jgi:uncharacterized membrane protein